METMRLVCPLYVPSMLWLGGCVGASEWVGVGEWVRGCVWAVWWVHLDKGECGCVGELVRRACGSD